MSEILKGWGESDNDSEVDGDGDGDALENSSGNATTSDDLRSKRLSGSSFMSTTRAAWRGSLADASARPSWRTSTRSIAGWSSAGDGQGQGTGGGGGGKASIVSALEKEISRSTCGGDLATPQHQPRQEKNRSEELFGALMGQDALRGAGGGGKGRGLGGGSWAHGADGGKQGKGAAGRGGKGEDGKAAEVDLGFLLRLARKEKV